MKRGTSIAIILTLSALVAARADAADLQVFSSTALKSVLETLGAQFEKSTGDKLVFTLAPAAVIKTKIDQGAAFDVAIVTPPLLDALVTAGKVDAKTRAVIARSGLGVSVPAGAPKPDVSTPEALKRALANAKSIGFNGQGASRAAVKAIFAKLGMTEALKPKIKLLTGSAPDAVAKHEVELALSPISEIIAVPGAQLAGALPTQLQWYLVLEGAVAAPSKAPDRAKALMQFLTAPSALPVLKASGMEPAAK